MYFRTFKTKIVRKNLELYLVRQKYDADKRMQMLTQMAMIFPIVSNRFAHFRHPSLEDQWISSISPSINVQDTFLSLSCEISFLFGTSRCFC